ncbi:hypothetical protein [Rickettsia honei]|uniref:hypothetical protein n=1 Tax=Rickettsia honei TaxID=37816 RepID=UPI0004945CF8|nr:hypothetical protein [Rickettsia honei]
MSNTSVSAIKVETEIIGNMSGDPMHGQMPTYYKQIKNVKLEYPIGKLQFRNQDSNKAILKYGKNQYYSFNLRNISKNR